MAPMRITGHDIGDVTVLELDGRLILEEGELALRDAVDRAGRERRVNIVLDCAQSRASTARASACWSRST